MYSDIELIIRCAIIWASVLMLILKELFVIFFYKLIRYLYYRINLFSGFSTMKTEKYMLIKTVCSA
jgi:hypothetical protein